MSKIWFITGASSGLGAELAKAAMERGDKAVASFRNKEQAARFSGTNSGKGLGVVLDVTNPEQLENAVQKTVQRISNPVNGKKTKLIIGEPKTSTSRRFIPIPDILVERIVLQAILKLEYELKTK